MLCTFPCDRYRHQYLSLTGCEQAFNMESFNIFNISNGSSVTPQHVLNDSWSMPTNNILPRGDSFDIATIAMCALGLPGNVLLFAVYVRKMTTSTRVYMFALAVADLVVCVCPCLFLSARVTDAVAMFAIVYIIYTSITFSMFLLVFVSIERLVAVKRPHTFSMDPQRAKKYTAIIVVVAPIFTTLLNLGMLMSYIRLVKISFSFVSVSCVIIMITCYTLMAAAMLKKVRASQNQVGVLSVTRPSKPGCSHRIISTIDDIARASDPGPSNFSTKVKANVHMSSTKPVPVTAANKIIHANQAKAFKNVLTLFITTIVFIACWVPMWLAYMDIYIPTGVIRSMITNSVINPFIYGVASAQFRDDVRQFYRQTRVKLSACYN